jgi:iron complex outermembrane receptor protein
VGETPESGGREALGRLDEWGGRLGLSATLGHGRTVLHAGLSRRGRFPALRELYSGALGRFAPNPHLKPEVLVTTEAGATVRLPRGEAQVVAFHNRLSDAVVRITLEDRRFMRVNQNELASTGLELLGSHKLGPVILAGDLTVQSVELSDPEGEHRPENLPELFGNLSAQAPLFRKIWGGASVAHTGEQFCIDPVTGEDATLEAQTVASAFLSRTWTLRSGWKQGLVSEVEARISADNLGDVAQYDAFGLPEPGRRFRLELRVR